MKFQRVNWCLAPLGLMLGSTWLSASVAATIEPPVALASTASAQPMLMHAKWWQAGQAPSAFLVSEKLDGVRAYWDGQSLRFRSGRLMATPDWFTASLPKTALDGELWLGRGRFDELSGIVRHRVPVDADWRAVRYMIFDLPGSADIFSKRAEHMKQVVLQTPQPWLQAVAQQHVGDAAALQNLLTQTVTDGGEGLVLHRANALWSPGRSDALLKLKPVPDEEARVLAHLPGKGRHQGRMGALLLETPKGQRFALGTGFTDAQRADPPALGTWVTYRYRDRTPRGLPKFASFLRVRSVE